MFNKSSVIWITGLSGVGKSTVACALQMLMQEKGYHPVVVDGDMVREMVGDADCRHDRRSRIVNAYRISRLAKLIAEQQIPVIVATMSLYHEIHAWNRRHLPGYLEIYMRAEMETLVRRDPKKLYRKVREGQERDVVGLHLAYEAPLSPHICIDNDEDVEDVRGIAETIFEVFKSECGAKHEDAVQGGRH